MQETIEIRSLSASDISEMHQAFIRAFSDYPLTLQMDREQFVKKFVMKLDIDYDLSGGAFTKGRMVGFIFTSVGRYNGLNTAYNGGTGVIPEFRGLNLAKRIYRFLLNKFRNNHIDQCALEVLTDNEPAIAAYYSVGFQPHRLLRCFKIQKEEFRYAAVNPLLTIIEQKTPDWSLYRSFTDFESSFLDQTDRLSRNIQNEVLLEAWVRDVCAGFSVYQPDIGRVSQFAVRKDARRRGIATALFHRMLLESYTPYLTVLNIDEGEVSIKKFLKKIGFKNRVNQYEMILKLNHNDTLQ